MFTGDKGALAPGPLDMRNFLKRFTNKLVKFFGEFS